MKLLLAAWSLGLLIGCSNNGGTGGGAGGASAGGGGSSGSADGGSTNAGGSGPTGSAAGGNSGSGGGSGTSGTSGTGGGSSTWNAGNPDGSCTAGVPAEGQPVDTSNSTNVVGDGTAGSCTCTAPPGHAVTAGGADHLRGRGGAITIPITSTLNVPYDKDTVIDGGQKVTLDGQHQQQIMQLRQPGLANIEYRPTLQHIALIQRQDGRLRHREDPAGAVALLGQGWDEGQGGAVFMRDGNLTVIDCIFTGNQAAPLGPDTGGGAIYVQGSKHGTVIVGSTFQNNQASNAAAVGGLFCEHHIYNSLFSQNTAVGSGANNNDPSKCSVMNNGQNEVGSGGNGGAIYSDGNSVNLLLCGDKIVDNAAGMGAFGGGLFFTSNNMAGDLSIIDTTMMGNTGGSRTNVATGSMNNAGSAVGTNCHSLTIQNSNPSGRPPCAAASDAARGRSTRSTTFAPRARAD